VATGIALARSLSRAFGVELRLKWPNDLLAGGRKLGGILVEGRALPDGTGYVVVGLGLNVGGTRGELDALGLPAATSLALQGADPAALEGDAPFVAVLAAFDAALGEEIPDLPSAFEEVTVHRHGDVLEVRDGERRFHGRYAGLTEDGLLRLDTGAGVTELISGDVTSFRGPACPSRRRTRPPTVRVSRTPSSRRGGPRSSWRRRTGSSSPAGARAASRPRP
jgi:BirA family biotin operon repressor/biotin-[acetyl-CoA-carboxylase] ligase